jgi:sugar O-acyltransferase (sialic acid O-acetyltransferase NeuD family)
VPSSRPHILVYGGGGHAKVLLDLLAATDSYTVVGVVDDHLERGLFVLGTQVLGGAEVLPELVGDGVSLAVNGVGGISRPQVRREVFDRLAWAGLTCPAMIHPTALVEPSATLEDGVQVLAHAYVGSAARVGFGSLLNTAAVVNHDCLVGRHVGISPGALLAGAVTLGDRCLVGMGATVNVGVVIGEGALVGNSAVVKADVGPGAIVHAGEIWPDRRPVAPLPPP